MIRGVIGMVLKWQRGGEKGVRERRKGEGRSEMMRESLGFVSMGIETGNCDSWEGVRV